MVHETLLTKKLDFEIIHNLKVCKNDWHTIETIFKLKNSDRIVVNPSIILPGNFRRIFYHIKCPNYELITRHSISYEIVSIMDLTETIQYKFVTFIIDDLAFHKKML